MLPAWSVSPAALGEGATELSLFLRPREQCRIQQVSLTWLTGLRALLWVMGQTLTVTHAQETLLTKEQVLFHLRSMSACDKMTFPY